MDFSRKRGTAEKDELNFKELYVVSKKIYSMNDVRSAFEKFGKVSSVKLTIDDTTLKSGNEPPDIMTCIICFETNSSAADAYFCMCNTPLCEGDPSLKVFYSFSKNPNSNCFNQVLDLTKFNRVFIRLPREMTDEEIKEEYSKYGEVISVKSLRRNEKLNGKIPVYITYKSFKNVTEAIDNIPSNLNPRIAEPRSHVNEEKSSTSNCKRNISHGHVTQYSDHRNDNAYAQLRDNPNSVHEGQSGPYQLEIFFTYDVSPYLLSQLCDFVVGFIKLHVTKYCDAYGPGRATAEFTCSKSVYYANKKLNGFEYPPGYPIKTRCIIDQRGHTLGNSPFDVSNHDNDYAQQFFNGGIYQNDRANEYYSEENYSNAIDTLLPPIKPLAPPDSEMQKRLYFVCYPLLFSKQTITDIFSRFGFLINANFVRNKNYGYARYASAESADKAIEVLNGLELFGAKLKVTVAIDPSEKP